MQADLPVCILATRTSSNLVADALISGIIKVGILQAVSPYILIRIDLDDIYL